MQMSSILKLQRNVPPSFMGNFKSASFPIEEKPNSSIRKAKFLRDATKTKWRGFFQLSASECHHIIALLQMSSSLLEIPPID